MGRSWSEAGTSLRPSLPTPIPANPVSQGTYCDLVLDAATVTR
jgi:hypothetical protein